METIKKFLDGCGDGSGDGSGSGYGCGDGCGDGYGISKINSKKVYIIDDIQTIITKIKGNIATGFILQSDLTMTPCYIVKEDNVFAHGKTLRDAFNSIQEKLYDNSTEDERLSKFKEKFKDFSIKHEAKELFVWHHILTGSCKAGRESFAKDRGIDIENDKFTIHEFIELTKNNYGGDIIKKLTL